MDKLGDTVPRQPNSMVHHAHISTSNSIFCATKTHPDLVLQRKHSCMKVSAVPEKYKLHTCSKFAKLYG